MTIATSASAATAAARLDGVVVRDGPGADHEAANELAVRSRVVGAELVAAALLQLDGAADLRAAHPEEGAAAQRFGQLDDRLAVDLHRGRPDGAQAELPRSGGVGDERAADPRRERRRVDPLGRRLVPEPHQAIRRHLGGGAGRVAETEGEVAVDGRQVLGDRTTRFERDVEPARLQRLQRSPPVVRMHPRAATALRAAVTGVRADQRNAPCRCWQRQHATVVLQQHRPSCRRPPDDRSCLRVVGGDLRRAGVGGARPVGEGEHTGDRAVEIVDGHVAALQGGAQVLAASSWRAGHLHIEPGEQRLGRAVRAEPVADDEAVEAPLVAQQLGQQPVVLAAERAVEAVVAGHDHAHVGPADGGLERDEVQLAQRAFVDLRGDRHPLELGVVADEVLDARGHTLGLQPADVGDGELRRQDRILAVALEVAPADRGAVQVHRRGEHDVGALGVRLPPERPTNLLDELRIPGRTEGGAARERGRCRSGPRRPTDTSGPVGHADRRHRRVVESGRVPRVDARQQGDLLVGTELGEQVLVEAGRHGRMVAMTAAEPPRPSVRQHAGR